MIKKVQASLIDIVNQLADGEYHDGTAIGQSLNITRSAVWKTIKKLTRYHIKIDSIKGKGYALREPISLLDLKKIKKSHPSIFTIHLFETIDSTNEYLKKIKNVKQPVFCLAEHQTQGKGRFNRKWYSPFGQNIYLSCRFPFKKDVSELAGLSLVVGLVVRKTLKQFGLDDRLKVKWPNDIYYDNKKLSGVLIEIQAESHDGISHAIIGIGINVNLLSSNATQISQPWISMRKILNQMIDRNLICRLLIQHLIENLNEFEAKGFSPFMDEWMLADCLMNKTIMLRNLKEKLKGTVRGINHQGQLLLQLNDGSIKALSSGDATIM